MGSTSLGKCNGSHVSGKQREMNTHEGMPTQISTCHVGCFDPSELMGPRSLSPGRTTNSGVQEASENICAESPLESSPDLDHRHFWMECLAKP